MFSSSFNALVDEILTNTRRTPAVAWEDDKAVCFRFEAPGCNKEDIDVSIEDRILTVKAKKKQFNTGSTVRYIYPPIPDVDQYSWAFTLGKSTAESDEISAEYTDGIISVKIGKTQSKVKNISVL